MDTRRIIAASTFFLAMASTSALAQSANTNLTKDELAAKENAKLVNDTVACIQVRYDRSEMAIRNLDNPVLNPALPFKIVDAGAGVSGVHLNCPNNVCASGTLIPDEARNHCASLGVTGEVKFAVQVGAAATGQDGECTIEKVQDGDVIQVSVISTDGSAQTTKLQCALNPQAPKSGSSG